MTTVLLEQEKKLTHKRTFCEARHDSINYCFRTNREKCWYDFVFNINFDKNDINKAYHKIWLNGQLVHQRYNQTLWLDQNGINESNILGNMV